MQRKLGKDLQPGDVIKTWYGPMLVKSAVPYTGPLAYLFAPAGAQLMEFANGPGMTIDNSHFYELA
jgi:hypothetical protein